MSRVYRTLYPQGPADPAVTELTRNCQANRDVVLGLAHRLLGILKEQYPDFADASLALDVTAALLPLYYGFHNLELPERHRVNEGSGANSSSPGADQTAPAR
jgi:hypothetical protein